MPDKLSAHFTVAEMTITQQRGLNNDPPLEVVAALRRTAQGLERVRERLGGHPLIISSGYRSPAVNAAVGGSKTSQHMLGEAADFICPYFGSPLDIVYALRDTPDIEFDQLIEEFGRWVHISFCDKPRGQAFRIDKHGSHPLP